MRLAPETEDFAEVVDEAGKDHPARLAVGPEMLGRLEEVFQLRKIGVGIGVVDQLVEVFGGLPDPHLAAVEAKVFRTLGEGEFVGLVGVVQPVELPNGRPGVGFVVAELPGLLFGIDADGRLLLPGGHGLRVAFLVEVLHFVE